MCHFLKDIHVLYNNIEYLPNNILSYVAISDIKPNLIYFGIHNVIKAPYCLNMLILTHAIDTPENQYSHNFHVPGLDKGNKRVIFSTRKRVEFNRKEI